MTNKTLFLVGGTGALGLKVAIGLVTAEGFDERKAIVRSASKAQPLADLGWTLVEVPDYQDATALEQALAGAKTVVSTFGGADMVALETATIAAAKKVGATLFVPSQFGVDYRRWNVDMSNGGHPFIAAKYGVLQAAKEADLATLSVFVGYFADIHFDTVCDIANAKARIVGDGSAKTSFTLRSDIGNVLAKALNDPAFANGGMLSLHGETMSWKEAIATLEAATGKTFEIEYIDNQVALEQEKDLLAKGFAGDFGALFGSFILHLIGEPARGQTGSDVSAEANSYGHNMASLSEILQGVYTK